MESHEAEERRRTTETGLIRWTFAAQTQLRRVREAQRVLTDRRQVRPTHYGDAERQPFLSLFTERNFLLVSLAQIGRSLALLEAEGMTPTGFSADNRTRIRLLRNIFEHWYEGPDKLRSLTQFERTFPDQDPQQHRWSEDGSVDQIGGLSLNDAVTVVEHLHDWVLELERSGWVFKGGPVLPPSSPQ